MTIRAGTESDETTAERLAREGWMEVTSRTHPHLHEALDTISHDGGGGAGHERFSVPIEWWAHVEIAERALASLSDEDELQTFCIGEETEIMEIAARSRSLRVANLLLGAFFDDWNVPLDHVGAWPPLLSEVSP